ncbi:MAG TPA: energy transducer TonB [Vitreimonas sp.]|uniref:energy transducer TonB n=1 Tax=Vitreimonas sp. TaxID=3069702 RepID=UPI002D3279A8|nr:energy transducer TonB [Vitreimonas sp.]HYD85865.1 energy transducer TonB [Vitreimonas sp.]
MAGLLIAAAPAHAQRFADEPTLTIRPNSSADLNLPRVNASVRLGCAPAAGAASMACEVLEEAPADLGFGPAAVRIASRFRSALRVEPSEAGALTIGVNFCFGAAGACIESPPFGAVPIELEDAALANLVEGPRLGDLSRHYPHAARRARIEASVNVQCRVGRNARYEECAVLSEEPLGWGFGGATLALLRRARAPSISSEGRSLIGHLIIVPVSFSLP